MEHVMEKTKRITIEEKITCTGKIKYNTFEEASVHLKELKEISMNPKSLHLYECTFCGGFHCGNTKE
jgi:hypothetical protein